MSSFVRPSLIRHAQRAVPIKRAYTKHAFPVTKIPKTPAPSSTLSRNLQCRTTSMKDARTPIYIAAFHSSPTREILPPLPQQIDGTANDPAPVPNPSPTHGSYHWAFERIISASLIPLTVAPFAAGSLNPIMDAILCATILIHSHIGFQSIIVDYIPTHRLPITRKIFWWGLRGATLLVAVGLYEFETNDIGVTETIMRIWTT